MNKINRLRISKFVDKTIKFRWVIAILIPLITIMMATSLKNLEFEGSYRIWFDKDSKILKKYDDFRAIFGNDDAIIISFTNEDGIFTREALTSIQNITKKLWETEYIARVDSITNYQYIHSDKEYPDEILVENFIQDLDTYTAEDFLKKKKIALTQDMIVSKLISKDAKTTMIVGRMVPKAGDDPEVSFKLRDATLAIIAPESEKYGFTFHLNGGPVINSSFIEIAESDASTFTPLVIVIATLLLYLVFRKMSSALLSISVVIFTFMIVLSIQVIFGFKLNNFTANIPVFVMAIGIADAMHLLWIYTIARKDGKDNIEAIHYSVHKNALALFLTSLTTSIGFASLSISEVVPIKTLGIATASAAILAFVLTMLFVPAILAIINPKIKPIIKNNKKKDGGLSHIYVGFLQKYNKVILVVTSILFIVIGIGIFKAEVDSNTVRYFKENVPFRADTAYLEKNLTGAMSYEIIVDSKKRSSFFKNNRKIL